MANGDNYNVTLSQIRQGTAYFQLDNTTISNEIKAVQKVLRMMGYYTGGTPDGKYGSGTQAAVKGFQNENGISVDGCIKRSTLLAIENWSGTIYATPTNTPTLDQVRKGLDTFSIGDSGSAINFIRSLLISKGYSCPSSGNYDTTLAGTISVFQSNMGLTADGVTGQATLAVLEDNISDTNWLVSGIVNLTAGKLARAGFTKILLRRDIVSQMNDMFNLYGINTKKKVRHYLAQFMAETQFGDSITEYIYKPGQMGTASYAPYYGAGCIQFTWENNYSAYSNYKGDPLILGSTQAEKNYATQHVAIAYPADSAGYYWVYCRNIDSLLNWNSTNNEFLCRELTNIISGSYTTASTRYSYYLAINAVLR